MPGQSPPRCVLCEPGSRLRSPLNGRKHFPMVAIFGIFGEGQGPARQSMRLHNHAAHVVVLHMIIMKSKVVSCLSAASLASPPLAALVNGARPGKQDASFKPDRRQQVLKARSSAFIRTIAGSQ